MNGPSFKVRAKVWLYAGSAAWHFVTLPKPLSRRLKALFGGQRPGFGSIRVEVTAGTSVWKTSLFPDSKSGAYVLPLKKDVRVKEGLMAGKMVQLELKVQV